MRKNIIEEDLNYIYSETSECNFDGANILITGCAGFLGYYITNYFVMKAKELNLKSVIALDSFFLRKYPSWLNDLKKDHENILRIEKFCVGSEPLNKIPNLDKVTHIIHMASIASPTFYRKYPLETIDANVWGLRDLLNSASLLKNLKNILFFSSSEIYGDPDPKNIPTSENYRGYVSCVGPRSCYDESKRFGETLCYVFRNQYNLPITIVRPFNNYGPGMNINDKRLPADLAACVIQNKDIIILSDGTPTRTFCYVSDAIIGYVKALNSCVKTEFNIGKSSPEISVLDFAKEFRKIGADKFNYTGNIQMKTSKEKNYLDDNPHRRKPETKKASRLLNFNAKIEVYEGISRYLDFLIYK